MSQHDYDIADAAGLAFLADLNAALKAGASLNSGPTAPATTYAHMWWADTTANILKRRNAANTAWINAMSLTLAISAFAETLLDDADASTMLSTLGFSSYIKGLINDADAATARATLGVAPLRTVRGLTGNVNATTPLTKFDLSATAVVLQDANGATVLRTTGTALTCDLGLAGAVANGRDQAGAFAANSWVHLYYIWNGTTLATIASLSATGPTLPSGYTHWAYATALRWNASSNIIKALARGRSIQYDTADADTRVVSTGTATSFTSASIAGFVPPNALMARINGLFLANHNATQPFELWVRPSGSSSSTGLLVTRSNVQVAGGAAHGVSWFDYPVTSQLIEYKMNVAPNISGGAFIDVMGYTVPNGDA